MLNNMLNDIDGSLGIVSLDPFNQKILAFHQGQARSLDALDAGYDVPKNVGQRGLKPNYGFSTFRENMVEVMVNYVQ